MNKETLLILFKEYKTYLISNKYVKKDNASKRNGSTMQHIIWMCEEGIIYVKDGEIEKANRWLGFIQGVFWIKKVFSIDEMRKHVLEGGIFYEQKIH